SLSFIYSKEEFVEQVDAHTRRIENLFGQRPRVFRNTELIYSNELARFLAGLTNPDGTPRFLGALCEGVDRHLGHRSPNYLYAPPGENGGPLTRADGTPFGLLLKNYRLSDDVAFRFSNRGWSEWPLSAERFAQWVHQI